MDHHALAPPPEEIPLRGGRDAIALHATGLRHPRGLRIFGPAFTAYEDVVHYQCSGRGFRLGTRQSVYSFPRGLFRDPAGPERLAEALMNRLAALPGGAARIDHMVELEKAAARRTPVRATWVVSALCVLLFPLQRLIPLFDHVGYFSATLVRAGEWWRVVTANLLHADFGHLALNVLALTVIGILVERALGAARALWVIGVSGIAAMLSGIPAGYEFTVGASGIVSGLVGALLWLELRCADELPVTWRVPRGPLIAVVALDGLISFSVPWIAGAAHAAGFVAGMAATALVAGPALHRRAPAVWLRACNLLLLLGVATSLATAGWLLVKNDRSLARHAALLVDRPGVPPLVLNNFAWTIATDDEASEAEVKVALALAERAVEETGWRDPNIVDTLAEAQFASGDAEAALATIDVAIRLAPTAPYFREQRRRFLGERDDRPPPPEGTVPIPREERPHPRREPGPEPSPADGVRV